MDIEDFIFDTRTFLTSIKNSIDGYVRIQREMKSSSQRDSIVSALLIIEEMRIRVSIEGNHVRFAKSGEFQAFREELLVLLRKLLSSIESVSEINSIRFFKSPSLKNQRYRFKGDNLQYLDKYENIDLLSAIKIFENFITEEIPSGFYVQETLKLEDLRNIVPAQQVSPVHFDVINGKIVISHTKPIVENKDVDNISNTLDHIQKNGNDLIEKLKNSNCDRRLLEAVINLHTEINSNNNIIKIGLSNIHCQLLAEQFKPELPDAYNGMFMSYNVSISLYVSQFPEWEQFINNASKANITNESVIQIERAADNILDKFDQNPDLSDPEVPKTIKFIRDILKQPKVASKKIAYAVARTIENLVSIIVKYVIKTLDKTAEKSTEAISGAASKIIVGLLALALSGAVGLSPVSAITGASWIKQAADLIQKKIYELN